MGCGGRFSCAFSPSGSQGPGQWARLIFSPKIAPKFGSTVFPIRLATAPSQSFCNNVQGTFYFNSESSDAVILTLNITKLRLKGSNG